MTLTPEAAQKIREALEFYDSDDMSDGFRGPAKEALALLNASILPKQEPLGAEFAKVLDDNLSELLVRDWTHKSGLINWGESAPRSTPDQPDGYSELMSCPFCGGKAEIACGSKGHVCSVSCTSCGAEVSGSHGEYLGKNLGHIVRGDADKRWNTRSPMRESGTQEGVDPISQKAMNESSFALWQSHCDKKMQIEDLTDLCRALADSLETYADECHAEDVITERELIAKARKITHVEDGEG